MQLGFRVKTRTADVGFRIQGLGFRIWGCIRALGLPSRYDIMLEAGSGIYGYEGIMEKNMETNGVI